MQEENIRISRDLPQAQPDTNAAVARGGRYGEMFVLPLHGKKHHLADEGSYFIITNPTPGSTIAVTTSIQAFAETAGAVGVGLFLKNNEQRTSAFPQRVYLDYIKLLVAAIPTGATSWQYALVIDDNPVRCPAGTGTQLFPVSPNGDWGSSLSAALTCYFGALTTAVPTNRRTVGRGTLRGVVPTVFDEYVIVSGGEEGGGSMASGAASGRTVNHVPPIILGAQQNLCLSMWGAGNGAAAQFEVEIGGWLK